MSYAQTSVPEKGDTVKEELSNKSHVIVAHRLFHGVCDDLKKYLVENMCEDVWFIGHEFSSLETRRSFIEHYSKGKLVSSRRSFDYRFLPDALVYVKDFLYTVYCLLFRISDIDFYYGFGGFNAFCGSVLRRVKNIGKVIFYTIDYVPVRFESRLLNRLYHLIDRFELAHASETWNLSPRMAEGREEIMGLSIEKYPNQVVVPVGIWFDEVTRRDFSEINTSELLFVGHLLEKQGIQLVLEAVPDIVREIPEFRFRIIGKGEYQPELEELIHRLGIEEYVEFEGPIYDIQALNESMATAALAVAMYDRDIDDFTYYADPTKIKTYLSVGLPLLLTDVPYNAKDIHDRKCGKIVEYDRDAIATAVIELMRDKVMLREYRENAINYAKGLNWNMIFENNLGRLLGSV